MRIRKSLLAAIKNLNVHQYIKWISLIFACVLLFQATLILFIKDESILTNLTDLTTPVIGILSAAALFYTAIKVRPDSPKFFTAWHFLALGCLAWVLGDVCWAILEVFLHEEPYPSIADFFYLLYYPLVIVGFIQMPYEQPSRNDRIKNWLDMGIVFMAAGLIYWNFLIVPSASFEETDWITFLTSLAYPVFDFVLLATLSLLLYRKQTLLGAPAQLFLMGSILIQIIFDTVYGLQSIAGTYQSGTLLDLTWQVGLATFGLAGLVQLKYQNTHKQNPMPQVGSPLSRKLYSWMGFAPYLWLAAAYGLMVYAQFATLPMSNQEISIAIGLMIGLVLARQIITILETSRLSDSLKLELTEHKRTQERLQKSTEEMEDRVRQRTIELSNTNHQMQVEIEERLRTQKQLEESITEKDMLLQEIHHRVKNNLQVISSMLKLQSNQFKEPTLIASLLDSQNRVQSMALIHEKLYQSTNLANVDFAGYLESLVAFLQRSYGCSQKDIFIHVEAEPVVLGIDYAVPCGLIVNELVSNALKHAFPNQDKGEISIRLQTEATQQKIQLLVSDDGVGIQEGVDLSNPTSLGLQLVKALVSQLEGILEVHNHHGSHFIINFSTALAES
jgi:two-component sensor histidine kinase